MDGIVKDGSPVEDVDATARRFNLLSINFVFDIPEKYAPAYVSKKKSATPKRGHLAKPKTVTQEY